MKKAILTIGLFTLVMGLTSFTTPEQKATIEKGTNLLNISGSQSAGNNKKVDISGSQSAGNNKKVDISGSQSAGGNKKVD
ncbi:3-oxoacyl-ACP reductase [Flavobacterium sp.]|uniref:3-oxoacyl-ACP reductase n=1 Tax=Flavobacterium sp. TaxID=239 RepID=UPI00262C2975|nr:3-oxoacyl-ACP reductase [Flavobacterium sp.]